MSLVVYKILHLAGVAALCVALGALALLREPEHKKLLSIVHGVSLLVILVAGFGALAKLGLGAPPAWALAKVGVWFLLGGLIALPRLGDKALPTALVAVPVLTAIATWLAVAKPF